MSAPRTERPRSSSVFEIKGSSINLPAFRPLVHDMAVLGEALQEKIQQAPEFFRDAPVVLDLHSIEGVIDLVDLCTLLRSNGLVPVGVRGASDSLSAAAKQAHLAVFADTRHDVSPVAKISSDPKVPAREPVPIPNQHPQTRVIQQPVRSGQRIYAMGGDLVVLAPVSAGAEIMADGHIHVYGSLRGRALAGVQGDVNSRIFCMDLQAELVSVAGHYKVSENLDSEVKGHPVQIYLSSNALIIEDL